MIDSLVPSYDHISETQQSNDEQPYPPHKKVFIREEIGHNESKLSVKKSHS